MTQLRSRQIATLLALAALAACGSSAPGASGTGAAFGTQALGVTLGDVIYLVGVPSGRCVGVAGGSSADQAALELQDCSGAQSEQLRLETADGYYVLRVAGSDKCLAVSGASTSAGASIVQATCGGGTSQEWSGADLGGGTYRITSRSSGMAIDAYGAGRAAGTKIIQWPENGGTNQQWRVVAATDVKSYTVTLATSGSGTTSPAPGTYTVSAGTTGTVKATPASGYTFTGWSGAATGTTNPLTVTVNGNMTLTANFVPATASYTLTIATSGSGTTAPAAGTHSYSAGTALTVTATPASGYTFTGWSGAATGTANPVTITMDASKTLTATFSGGCTPPAAGSKGTNPLFTDQYTADPAPLVDGCTFYIGCGHDEAAAGQNAFIMREWFLLSSSDMVHWTKKVALTLGTFKWASVNAWAGQMVKARNGKYYWYVPVQEAATGAMAIGVAVADSPGGPWTDALGKPLINDEFEMSNMGFATPSDTPFTIDPTVFVDDDGQAYLHYGGFWRMIEARLNSDMISVNGRMQESTPQGYFEAPYLIERDGTYYEIYAAGSNPATIDYATSSSPMGPWTYGGRVLDALPRASGETDWPTNHAGVAEFAGQWYIVYHVSDGPNGGGTYRREVAVDKLYFTSSGAIQKVVPSSGLSF